MMAMLRMLRGWRAARSWACGFGALCVVACGTGRVGEDFGRLDGTGRVAAGSAVRVRWMKHLTPEWGGPYVPVQRAEPALDPEHDRLFIGSTERVLWAMASSGEVLYRYPVESGIEAKPTLDPAGGELYVSTVAGVVHALVASTGELRWKAELSGAVSQVGLLSDDALYIVTDDDAVFAIARKDGAILWRYKREPRSGLKIGGHAGLLFATDRLVTGFSDGSIVALSAGDGRELWMVDTTLDLEDPAQVEQGFVDVDTTPVQVGDTVFAASLLGGLYGIQLADGTPTVRRAEWTGITSIATDERALVLASADHGVLCVELGSFTPRWVRDARPYVPGTVRIVHDKIYVTQTRGAMLALALADGREQGRIHTSHGFLAAPSMSAGRGFILANAGLLYAFDYY